MKQQITFCGSYSENQSTLQHACSLTLQPDGIAIVYMNEQRQEQHIFWALNAITKSTPLGKIKLQYSTSVVEITDPEFRRALARYYRTYSFASTNKGGKSSMSRGTKRSLWIISAIAAFVIFAYFIIVPNVAEYAANFVPLNIEKQIGESAYRNVAGGIGKHDERTRLVNEFFNQLNFGGAYEYKITVLNSYEMNAFAIPGGRIVIYNELINKMDSYEELAALLAHEFSHVEQKHSLKSVFRTLSNYLVISVLLGDAGSMASIILQNADMFNSLQYSRKMERQADMLGLDLLMEKQIDAQGMVRLFKTLKKESDSEEYAISEFVSTHPLMEKRIEYIREYIAQHPSKMVDHPELESVWKQIKEVAENDSDIYEDE